MYVTYVCIYSNIYERIYTDTMVKVYNIMYISNTKQHADANKKIRTNAKRIINVPS